MARRHSMPVSMPEPLPQAPVDPRLPERSEMREVERDVFAKNRGFACYDDYEMSRWKRPDPEKPDPGPTKETGRVETEHVPGMIKR